MTKHWMKAAALFAVIAMNRLSTAADLSGNWIAQIATQGEPQYTRVSLQVNGTTVTGMWGGSEIDGTLMADRLDIKLTSAGNPAGALTGTLTGSTFTGTGTVRAAAGARGGGGGGGGGRAAAGGT